MKIRCALSYQATTHSHYFILTREKEKILKVESDVIWLSIYAAKIKRKKNIISFMGKTTYVRNEIKTFSFICIAHTFKISFLIFLRQS